MQGAEMRRKDREIQSRDVIDGIITQAEVCRLGLSRDNHPYIVPVSFGYDGSHLYFHSAAQGMKIDYMLANPQVCFEMEQDVQIVSHAEQACKWGHAYTSVIGFGTVREITETSRKTEAMNHIMRHYSGKDWDFDAQTLDNTRLWCISIEHVTGKHREAK
jgi:nitroimidazol reductase NimA-like FMN-containing flavoprotein (pyridoxamine 5'-phosphate oxidase superfamily)